MPRVDQAFCESLYLHDSNRDLELHYLAEMLPECRNLGPPPQKKKKQ